MPALDPSLDNLQRFVDALKSATQRLDDYEEDLGEAKAELEAEAERSEPLFDATQAALEREDADLRAAAESATGKVNELSKEAQDIADERLSAAENELVALSAAVEAGLSKAAHELQVDADALTNQGFAVFEQITGTVEQALDADRLALIDAMTAVSEAIEEQARQTEGAAMEAVERMGQAEQAVDTETATFETAAGQSTAVWSDELPPAILDAVEEAKRSVVELYQAWDETDLEGHQEFTAALDQALEQAMERLDQDAEALQKAAEDAEDELVRLRQEMGEALGTAETGVGDIAALGDSFTNKVKRMLEIARRVADLLEVL